MNYEYPIYKSFKSLLEAQEWLNSGANYEKKEKTY